MAARKKKAGTAMVNMQAEMEKEIATIHETLGGIATNSITLTGKKFKFPTGQVMEAPLDIVILGYTSKNLYYPGVYDPKNPEPPVCWAVGPKPLELVPSANAPEVQAVTCKACPLNEFESGVGNAKACKNTREIAFMLPDAFGPEDTIYSMSVSPAALKPFDTYIVQLAEVQSVLPIAVITAVAFDPDVSHVRLLFGKPRPNPHMEQHWMRREEARTILTAEPTPRTGDDATGVKKKKVTKKKAKPATKKKAGRRRA